MMNKFVIKSVIIDKNRIDYEYDIEGDWRKYFNLTTKFMVEYSENIEGIPAGLACVPIVSNVLLLATLFHAKIYVPALDLEFYNSIPDFMNGFTKMYPQIAFYFKDCIICDNLVDSKNGSLEHGGSKSLLYFSGGVDAYTSLIRHENEELVLFTVCGADTWYNNVSGFENILEKNKKIAKLHNLSIVSCISNFRKFVNETEITNYIYPLINDNFWHGFQHGLGMFGLSAGYVYLFDLKKIYFASSFCEGDKNYTCGSDPSIDNFVHIGSSKIYHDGFELSRQNKIISLCDYVKKHNQAIKLRVCYSSSTGENCCTCEKCVRTMLGFISEGSNPSEFGFDQYDPSTLYPNLINALIELSHVPEIATALYGQIIANYIARYSYDECPKEMKAFYHTSFRDILDMLSAITPKEHADTTVSLTQVQAVDKSNSYYKHYIISNEKIYREFSRFVFRHSELHPQQIKDEWIGNHGFFLDSNQYVSKEDGHLILDLSRNYITFEGWAADFMNQIPLADVIVKIKNKYYSLNYGLENIHLAKRFQNTQLSNIVFSAEIPTHILKNMTNKTISFFMIGFKDDTIYRFPEIKYKVSIKSSKIKS